MAVERIQLDCGVSLLLQADHRLRVHLRAVMLGGPVYEDREQRGVGAILVELLTKDTQLLRQKSPAQRRRGGDSPPVRGQYPEPGDRGFTERPGACGGAALGGALRTEFRRRPETELEGQIAGLKEEDDEIFEFGFRKLREAFLKRIPLQLAQMGVSWT